MILKAILFAGLVAGLTNAFPSGAPTSACSSMTPSHGATQQPNDGNLFVIKTSLTARNTVSGKLNLVLFYDSDFIEAGKHQKKYHVYFRMCGIGDALFL